MLDVAKLPQSKQGIEEEDRSSMCVMKGVWVVCVVGGGRIDVPKCSVKYSLQSILQLTAQQPAASSSIPS